MCTELSNYEKKPPASYLLLDQEPTSFVNTVIGNVPVGSYLGYQLFDIDKEAVEFVFERTQENMRNHDEVLKQIEPFPKLPRTTIDESILVPPDNLAPDEVKLLSSIEITIEKAHQLFDTTVGQSMISEWYEARKKRLTASNFGLVLLRKKMPTEAFLRNIFNPKDLSNVESIRHGRQNEVKARTIYSCEMQKMNRKFTVFEAGLVVNPTLPFLGATPDGKVFDPTEKEPFGLLEIKCPFGWRDSSFQNACNDPTFMCEIVDGRCNLKRTHIYYPQVQGQLALSRVKWCDFVVFLSVSRKINVERIYYDEVYWNQSVLPKLTEFYFRHALKYLSHEIS